MADAVLGRQLTFCARKNPPRCQLPDVKVISRKSSKVCVFRARLYRGERTVSVPVETMPTNDRSDDNARNAGRQLLRLRTNAASALAAAAQGRFVPHHSSLTWQR